MAEATANQGGEQDPSMEEILQSIRRIIAEDGDGGDAAKADGPKLSGDAEGSDVLELTEMVSEDGSIVSLKTDAPVQPTTPAAASAPAQPAPAATSATDVLNQIDNALASPSPLPAAPALAAAAAVPAPAPAAKPAAPKATEDTLLSEKAAGEASSSIKKLQEATEPPIPVATTTPSPSFQSGNTVEGMVAAMLRPMIKEWLDENLPKIVERQVALEIRRLTK